MRLLLIALITFAAAGIPSVAFAQACTVGSSECAQRNGPNSYCSAATQSCVTSTAGECQAAGANGVTQCINLYGSAYTCNDATDTCVLRTVTTTAGCTTDARCVEDNGEGYYCNLVTGQCAVRAGAEDIIIEPNGPTGAGATQGTGAGGLSGFFQSLIGIIDTVLVPFIFAFAFMLFIWGIYLYFFLGAGNEEKRKEGRVFVVYGLIGFVVMFSLWGIVNVLVDTFGFGGTNRPPLPYE